MATVIIAIALASIVAFAVAIVVVSACIRREERLGTLTQQAPGRACSSTRRATGVGVRWAA
jgi:hypothetical protein